MSLFENKKSISRSEFRSSLKKAPSGIPGRGGLTTKRGYNEKERLGLERTFGKKYGSRISKKEYGKKLQELKESKYGMSQKERREADNDIRFLEGLNDDN